MKKAIIVAVAALFAGSAFAVSQDIVIENNNISASQLNFEAGKDVEIRIINKDDNFDEFEMKQLNVKLELPAKGEAIIKLPNVNKGSYDFKVEFENDKKVKGTVVVK